MSKLQEVADLTERGKAKLIGAAVQGALDEGTPAPEILNTMIDAMGVVGEKFKRNEIFVPEMLVAARAMKKGVEILKPHLAGDNTVSAGKLIIGTVAGDFIQSEVGVLKIETEIAIRSGGASIQQKLISQIGYV